MTEFVPGLQGIPVTHSSVSSLDGQKGILRYRGYPIEALAKNSNFEEVSWLLLNGELPSQEELSAFDRELKHNRKAKYNIREIMKYLPITAHPMEMLQTAVSSLGMFYPGDECLTNSEICEDTNYIHDMAVKIIARMGTLVAMWESIRGGDDPVEPRQDMTYAENFLYMMRGGEEPRAIESRIMDACLVLHAEHTINASTFTTLVTSSSLAAPNLVIAAAIGSLAGPLHGGANQRVVEMLKDIGRPENAEAWLENKFTNKQVVWGMGHREYKVKDPRANILQGLMMELMEARGGKISTLFETALKVEEICEERLGPKGVYPNVDFYSGILYSELGIPSDQFTPIFAVARSAGWLAHWKEQLSNNRIYRPTQIYVGPEQREYVPVNQR